MTGLPASFIAGPGGRVSGEIRVPGDKSISHRAVMLGAIAEGVTEVNGFLDGEDCLATLAAFEAMGVRIERPAADRLIIHGVGLRGLQGASRGARILAIRAPACGCWPASCAARNSIRCWSAINR